jgi:beta-phosphoglucomutase
MEASMTFAAIWDMDGVLVDTSRLHYQSWVQALAPEGVDLELTQFTSTFGMNNTSILKLLLGNDTPQERIDQVGNLKEEIFRQSIIGQKLVLPGVPSLLEALRQAGFRQAVASSAPHANIDVLLATTGLLPYFDAVVSAWGMPGKPDPAVYLEAAARLGVPPARCVVVEDATAGVEGARRAGMRCLAVTNTNPAELLSTASLVVDSLEGISADTFRQLLKQHQV